MGTRWLPPDETTFVRFRARLREAGLERTLFERTTAELDRRGLLVKEGSLVDAMIVEQARGSKRDDGTSTRDPEASFTKKHGETYHGYKGSINADRSALVAPQRAVGAVHHAVHVEVGDGGRVGTGDLHRRPPHSTETRDLRFPCLHGSA